MDRGKSSGQSCGAGACGKCRGMRTPQCGTAAVRSACMQTEEIERERAASGWNPYIGEEELPVQPYFMMPEYAAVLEEQKESERDLRKLQGMYPEGAKILLPYIEEACDKMEFEGSTMYDEYPDRTTVQRIAEHICGQVRGQFPEEPPAQQEEVLTMQYRGPGRNRPGQSWLGDMVRVLLLGEMHHRRCRYRDCRKRRM